MKNSAGVDGIPAECLRLTFLVPLFNKMFDLGCFPEMWAKSVISPIHKKGDTNLPTNYRSVCLQPVLSKVFTSILNKRLKHWSSQHKAKNRRGFAAHILQYTIYSAYRSLLQNTCARKVVEYLQFV